MDYRTLNELGTFLKSEHVEKKDSIQLLNEFIETGKPLPFADMVEAHSYIERQRKNGFPIKQIREKKGR